jgi:cytochrome c oxidase subunit IV
MRYALLVAVLLLEAEAVRVIWPTIAGKRISYAYALLVVQFVTLLGVTSILIATELL